MFRMKSYIKIVDLVTNPWNEYHYFFFTPGVMKCFEKRVFLIIIHVQRICNFLTKKKTKAFNIFFIQCIY